MQGKATDPGAHDNPEERERVEALVRSRTAELTELAAYLYRVREEERRALARELHDELGSLLTAAKLDLGFIKSKCVAANPALLDKCTRLAAMLDEAMALKRRIIDHLRPSTLDMLGLSAATRELVDNFAASSQINVRSEIDPDIDTRNDDALAVYRILQEALTNVGRHAEAGEVDVKLVRSGDVLHARVIDNGKGFLSSSNAAGIHGLDEIRERARGLGGKVAVDSHPGSGTTVDVWIPIRSG